MYPGRVSVHSLEIVVKLTNFWKRMRKKNVDKTGICLRQTKTDQTHQNHAVLSYALKYTN